MASWLHEQMYALHFNSIPVVDGARSGELLLLSASGGEPKAKVCHLKAHSVWHIFIQFGVHLLASIAQQHAANVQRRRDLAATVALYVIVCRQPARRTWYRNIKMVINCAHHTIGRRIRYIQMGRTVGNLRRRRRAIGQGVLPAQSVDVRTLKRCETLAQSVVGSRAQTRLTPNRNSRTFSSTGPTSRRASFVAMMMLDD